MQGLQDTRHRHANTLASRRPRSTTSLRQITRSTPTSRLLLSALAITASHDWIRQSWKSDTGGGVGWCVLGYWAWRIWRDLRNRWKAKKGRRKDASLSLSITPQAVLVSLCLAVQSVAFFFSVGTCGPLRAAVLLSCTTLWATLFPSRDTVRIIGQVPGLFAGTAIAYTSIVEHTDVSPLIVILSSLLVTPSATRMREGSQTKDKFVASSSASVNVLAGLFSITIVIVLRIQNLIASPIPNIIQPNAHIISAVVMLGLLRFVHLPALGAGNRIDSKLTKSRDHFIVLFGITAIQSFALPPSPSRLDLLAILPLLFTSVLLARTAPSASVETAQWNLTSTSKGYWSAMSLLPPTWRPHLQTILHTPSSSRIFYFLLLNLAYMGVQMAYGVFTNSLGLISDSIHMLFDCLGLGVGLWASVAATWKPDGRYTYGYARVETLSGFANGCFLILISIFIIFEAIQRVLDPPEMDTQQLLLVSSIGLAINLWGMYATGGHHHHGHSHGHDDHSHGHGHSHGHSHNHVHAHEKKENHHSPATSHTHQVPESAAVSHSASPRSARMLRKRSSGTGRGLIAPLRSTEREDDMGQANGHSNGSTCDHAHDHGHGDDHRHGHHDHPSHHEHPNHHDRPIHDHQHDHHGDHDHPHDHEHQADHAHSHAHSHNMRGVFLHVLADTLGSVGVIISTLLIRWTGWTGFDPLASLFIAGLIMASVIPLVIDSGKVLCLDVGSETEAQIRTALSELATINGLANYASPRFWPRSEGKLSGSIHIHLAPSPANSDPSKGNPIHNTRHDDTIYANVERVVAAVDKVLKRRIRGLTELVVQVEGSEGRSFCGCMTGSG